MSDSRVIAPLVAALLLSGCGGGGTKDPDPEKVADGRSCSGDEQCVSGHCDSGLCCRSGTCCADADGCPASYRSAAVCAATTTPECRGSRTVATCDQHICGSTTVEDDSGCAGRSLDCSPYKPVACTASAAQETACPSMCADASSCIAGYTCVLSRCVPLADSGSACTGYGQGSCSSADLQCSRGICCDATALNCCTQPSDCGDGYACAGHACKYADASSCVENSRCASGICRGGRCGSASELGGPCDVADGNADCRSGLACLHGFCGRPDGALCDAASDCASGICECTNSLCTGKACRSAWCGQCMYASGDRCVPGLGAYDGVSIETADPNPDDQCSQWATCLAGACKTLDHYECRTNSECVHGACRSNHCALPSDEGGPCDAGDSADCQIGLTCVASTCQVVWLDNGALCTDNDQCKSHNCVVSDVSHDDHGVCRPLP